MSSLFQIGQWILSAALILFFLIVAGFNLWVAWREWIKKNYNGPSMFPLLGGFIGAFGMRISTVSWLREHSWLASIVDVGCVPYFLLAMGFLLKEKMFGRE